MVVEEGWWAHVEGCLIMIILVMHFSINIYLLVSLGISTTLHYKFMLSNTFKTFASCKYAILLHTQGPSLCVPPTGPNGTPSAGVNVPLPDPTLPLLVLGSTPYLPYVF